MKKTINIDGMKCGHCEANVKLALEGIDGVESAVVSHEGGFAVITSTDEIPDDTLKSVIEEKGYTFVSVSAS